MADTPINSTANQEVVTENGREFRRTIAHLPAFYRTDTNDRFLSSTLDPLVQKGSLERLDGFVGKQDAYTRKISDRYVTATDRNRFAYQLDPAVTYTDKDTTSVNPEDQVKFTGTYDDYLNQIKFYGGKVNNQDRLNKETVYSWNPAIDYDKLINYREYYWMPEGPATLEIDSVGPNAVAEYRVQITPDDGSSTRAWKFPHRTESNPILKLYRGNTYKFNVDAKGHPFWIMTEPYKDKIAADGSTSTIYSTGVTNNGADDGIVTFTVPTTGPSVLYYQCGNHEAMYGILQIHDVSSTHKIDPVKDIIGCKNYSLRTLDLSNGMKISFANTNVTSAYQDREYYVEGVGHCITLTDTDDLITPETYATETTILYDTTAFDSRPYAKAFYRPETKDYITIKRDSPDRNAWSRYNRWTHRAVIEEVARIGGYTPVLKEEDRAKRPIIEFDSGIELFDHGTSAKRSVTLIDDVTTDVFSTVVNKTGYIVDGLALEDEMRVLFTADTDPTVKNKIYKVKFVQGSDSSKVIALTTEADTDPADKESVYVEFGTNNQGRTVYYKADTEEWVDAQKKTKVNQQPLFNLYDDNDNALSDLTIYPNSDFIGAKVFEFATSDTATTDTVLGIKVKYNTINNVGDIVFKSDHTSGTFTYRDGTKTKEANLATSHLHFNGVLADTEQSTWKKRKFESKQRVVRTFIVDATEKKLFPIDFYKNSATLTDIEISVSVNSVRKTLSTDYTIVDGTVNKYVSFNEDLNVDDFVKILAYSSADKIDDKGIYEIPENLSVNAHNGAIGDFTFGQVLAHVKDIFEKNTDVTGTIPGNSNLRDKPDARYIGGTIQQHGGSLLPAVFSLIDQKANLINAINFNSNEYDKWYNSFLTHGVATAYEGVAADRVDEIIQELVKGKTNKFEFYHEDMVGYGENVSVRTYTVNDAQEVDYAIDTQFDPTVPSNRAVYVYLNEVQLLLGTDYTFSTTDDSINITKTLAEGDKIKIKDYPDTTGSYIPTTPTKLGMYPKFRPEKFTDTTYTTDVEVIRRHDGSITKAYGDERDDLILELEKRIYNNCKVAYDATLLDHNDVIPSAFKSTDYKLSEVNEIMSSDFYTWAGKNAVQYINNTQFKEGSPFTYNYARSTDRLNSQKLPGYWRGIYQYFFDTDSPHLRPWECIGHSEKPADWESKYGVAPYTRGNDVLWNHIATHTSRYGKPDISTYLPVNESGELLDPIAAGIVKDFDVPGRQATWKFGDYAPAETAWRRSSAYPFSIIKLLALTKPAKFFSLYFDNSRLKTNKSGNLVSTETGIRQQLSTAKYHLETETNTLTNVTKTFTTGGYQPLIINYLISQNLDVETFFYKKFKNLDVQLAYKLGGFSDKENLKVLTDSVSPGSTSGSKFLPDENYKILFRTSNPVETYNFSGVLIEANTDTALDGSTLLGGYKVLGYSTSDPFFKFQYPIAGNINSKVQVDGVEVLEYQSYQEDVQTIPYGHVFTTKQEVANFLFGYGKYLESRGFKFDKFSTEIREVLNWRTAVREFLFWTTQSWSPGSCITVSPAAQGLSLETSNTIVGSLRNKLGEYSVLDAGARIVDTRDVSTKRLGKTFDIEIKDTKIGMYNLDISTVQKEHILLFDNKTVFNDIIYDKATGFRQPRLKLVGWKTGGWNGDYYAPGFVFDSAKVTYWSRNTDYKIGDSIEYQGKFYVALVNHNSGTDFDNSNWKIKSEKPASQLIPNFDYKISQFRDFYNLESNNFDESQQNLAQRLIGYQSRDYLENLFVNDISQYKFYQGYIREKGTQSAITRLLKAKYEDQDINLDIYPEWMIRTGEIGNVDAKTSHQIFLKEDEIVSNPQSIELADTSNDTKSYIKSLQISKEDFYSAPIEYTAATTFGKKDYTKPGVDREFVQTYKTAGYPQLPHVQHTLFSIDDLLTFDHTKIDRNDLIWIANKSNKDWDVFRVTNSGVRVNTVRRQNSATELEIETTTSHLLQQETNRNEADYIMLKNSAQQELDGIYKVKEVIDHKTFVIDYSEATNFLPQVNEDGSTADTYGQIFNFVSVRLASMNNVNDRLPYHEYKDKTNSTQQIEGDKVFADADSNGLWSVYEKQNPYTQVRQLSPDNATDSQDFGWKVVAREDARSIIASAPSKGQGEVHFFNRTTNTAGTTLFTTATNTTTTGNDNTSKLGYSLSMSSDENFVLAGAPFSNSVGQDGSTRFNDAGAVESYIWNPSSFTYGFISTFLPPTDEAGQNFGWAHKIVEPGVSSTRSTAQKYMFVSAPGLSSDKGRVYMYEWGIGADGSTYDTWTQCLSIDPPAGGAGQRFGHQVECSDDGNILAISSLAPGNAGKVEIFVRTSQSSDDSVQHSFSLVQTLTGVSTDGSSLNTRFGDSITMTKDGTTLVVGAPGHDDSSQTDGGAVFVYKWDANNDSTLLYTLDHTLKAPDTATNMQFGSSVHINNAGNRLVVGAEMFSTYRETKIDSGDTTFDLQDTRFVDINVGSGGCYTATKYDTKFVVDDLLVTDSVSGGDNFGKGVFVTDNTVIVGAPADEGHDDVSNDGSITLFDSTVSDEYAWKRISQETHFVDIDKMGQVFDYDSGNNQIRDWYDLYDPIQGRILGIADREINIKTPWDPAVYNAGTKADEKNAWLENHVGEVWWDLSKVKWLWYAQGTQEYKINNWGKTFPGSSIDIYEWIESPLLPSEYNTLANTDASNQRFTGLQGTPLDVTDNSYSVRQKYNSELDAFVPVYYYWVKNRVDLPTNSVVERKNSTSFVKNVIENPKGLGFKFYAVSDANKLLIWNVSRLNRDRIVLNFDTKTNTDDIGSHSIWKLVRESDPSFRPGTVIEKKWWDSLIGQNSEGDTVPDLDLPVYERYGNRTRPRQSWYADRFAALKEVIQYANSVLLKTQLAGTINLSNLDAKDPEPTEQSGEWDASVETYADLTYINTSDISGSINYLVKADETANGFWAIYTWDHSGEWSRTKIQTYNTSKYWSYIDWYKTDGDMEHGPTTKIDKQVQFEYELDSLDLDVGKHVKVTSADTGGWKIFMKTSSGYDNVGTENGTIKLSEKLYDYSIDATGYAGQDNFDDNFFDQTPSIETRKVLTALRDDIMINERAVEYNNMFFVGIRKVLAEQTYVDWLFKTSFINIKSSVRELDQRKTYSAGTDDWIEDYINEVKPFHTKVREYKLGYTGTETQDGIFSDFDNPPFYDADEGKIRSLNVARDSAKLDEYPWQMWNDHHKKHVESITVVDGGSGYTKVPTVTIVGGTVTSTGPFQILGLSASGSTSGQYGYFYPLFTDETRAKVWDSQNGGTGTVHTHTFDGLSDTFYMPTATSFHAQNTRSTAYKMYETPATTAATAKANVVGGEVTSITVTGVGANYTTTPTVIITGGTDTGANPSNVAKAYANLNNDLVRDIDTTIKFDRIKSTSSVVDWEASTSYVYGQLIRHKNQLYKATSAFTSTSKFDDNIDDLHRMIGDETGLTAADRTKGFYTPMSGMPGNELSQLMKGVDYGGTMVTGLLFNQGQGWDKQGWYDFPWDNYGESDIIKFVADGSTATYTFSTAPASTKVYQVYITEDDSSRRKLDDVFRGDGSTTSVTLSETPNTNALVEFIPFDSDGVGTPTDDRTIDSIIKGGLFGSALGIAPSDIILEGDDFVNPDTSYAPEEAVPGQMFDTVDIKVYTSPESGVPFVSEKNYRGNGSTRVFSIGDYPGTLGSVTVSVDGAVKKLSTDYTIDVPNKTITFGTAPANATVISTKVFAISGENYRVLDQYTGDGSTVTFTTSTRGEFNLDSTSSEIYITINGVPTSAYSTTTTANTITVTFDSAPAADALIQIAGFNKSTTTTRSYASIRSQAITYDGSTNRYTLTYPPGAIGPYSGLTIIEVNGRVLRGPDNTYYVGDGSTYTYGVVSGLGEDSTVDPSKTITNANQVEVYVNGTKKDLSTHYTVDTGNQNINFVPGAVPTSTDVIAISTLVDNHYYNSGNDIIIDPSAIASSGYSLTANDVMTVTTFNNALGMKQRREVLEGVPSGEFYLRFAPLNSDYTFVWYNGHQLVQNVDYTLNGSKITVYGKTITFSDRLDVMYFAMESAVGATGFRIFKDMLNRTFYKRISKSSTTKIAEVVFKDAKTIEVEDGSVLPTPDISNNQPGVIFVDKERIEYFTKSGTTLGQLRRGTLGTGIKEHGSGVEVVDASGTQTIPYADTVYTNTFTGDGSTLSFALSQTPASASELDIFIGGQRLLLTSEDGSTLNYSVDGSTTAVTLHTTAPASGTQIKILHKRGQVWYTAADGNPADGKGLQGSTTQQAKFIAQEPTNAPE